MFPQIKDTAIQQSYAIAREVYGEYGVDTDKAVERLAEIPVSLHCWQGDDVSGFERPGGLTDGGVQATGNYPGRARNATELRQDFEQAVKLIPGRLRINLHAIYAETGGRRVERNELEPEHFAQWTDWAKARALGVDFNSTFFSHPKSAEGFTLAHPDAAIRRFWVEHGQACRRIAAYMGRETGSAAVHNVWIPDGYKDIPFDRKAPRDRLEESLDAMFAEDLSPRHVLDAVECKLFGIGSESYVVGSHEFYMGYAITRKKLLCLDAGHFHPTETLVDKITATLMYVDGLLLHVSRGVRWDSDHVVTFSDDLRGIAQELVRHDFLGRVHVGLDFFDASINRIAAWVIGTRAMAKALLLALLEPAATLRRLEQEGDYTARLGLLEDLKTLPFGPVWDYYCMTQGVPAGAAWLNNVRAYEAEVLSKRS